MIANERNDVQSKEMICPFRAVQETETSSAIKYSNIQVYRVNQSALKNEKLIEFHIRKQDERNSLQTTVLNHRLPGVAQEDSNSANT